MTPQDIALVRSSLRGVDLIALADRFYEHLFQRHPEVRPLFVEDLALQRAKFAQELEAIVEAVADLEAFVERAHELGARHVEYGVRTPDYDRVGAALLEVLEERFPSRPDIVAAWAAAYALVAEAMLEGAQANPFAATPAGA